jgi:hypothetical protein
MTTMSNNATDLLEVPKLLEVAQALVSAEKWWVENQDSPRSALNHFMAVAEIARGVLTNMRQIDNGTGLRKALTMALQHIRICAPDPTVDAALESALTALSAVAPPCMALIGEAQIRAENEALTGCTWFRSAIPPGTPIYAASPAAPAQPEGGEAVGMSTVNKICRMLSAGDFPHLADELYQAVARPAPAQQAVTDGRALREEVKRLNERLEQTQDAEKVATGFADKATADYLRDRASIIRACLAALTREAQAIPSPFDICPKCRDEFGECECAAEDDDDNSAYGYA